MNQADLFAEAIKESIGISGDTIQNLASLIQLIIVNDPSDAEAILTQIKATLNGNSEALAILDKIEALLMNGGARLEKVISSSPGAAQQLALWVGIATASVVYPDEAVDFVKGSVKTGISLQTLAELARRVQDLLGGDILLEKKWQDAVIPSILDETLASSDLLALTASVSAGVNIPDQWKQLEIWISEWFRNTQKSPDSDGDILFAPQREEYQPAAVSPIVLRVARLQFIDDLNRERNQSDIRAFCSWLVDNIFVVEPRLPKLEPECAFAAGSLVLALGVQQGVTIREDGEVDSPNVDTYWKQAVESVLDSIVINSETVSKPSSWEGQPLRAQKIVEICRDWHCAPTILNLRRRARRRLAEEFSSLKATFTDLSQRIQSELSFSLDVENIASTIIPDLRPSSPITANANALGTKYFDKLSQIYAEATLLIDEDSTAQAISDISQKSRKSFESRMMSPYAQPNLGELVLSYISETDPETIQELSILWTYLCSQASKLPLSFRVGIDRWESLETDPNWINTINQAESSAINALKVWIKLELWDGLRGRLCSIEEEDKESANRFFVKIPSWLTQDEEPSGKPEELRPLLAALAHLGISPHFSSYKAVLRRLEELINRTDLDSSLRSLLAATRIEIGMSLLTDQTQTSGAFAFEQLNSDQVDQAKLLQWAFISLESQNAWENRAGINMLTLLSRLVGITSDPFLAETLYKVTSDTERGQEIIAYAVDILLGDEKTFLSGLPLALIAFDLERFTRDSTFAISSIKQPRWLQKVENPLVSDSAIKCIEAIADCLINTRGTALQVFSQSGAEAGKNLLLSIMQSKIIEYQFERKLCIEPLRRSKVESKQALLVQQLDQLRYSLRSVFCSEQLLLNGIKSNQTEVVLVSGSIAVGDLWAVEINGRRVEFVSTEPSIANVIDGISKEWNPSIRDISPNNQISIVAIQAVPHLIFQMTSKGSLTVEVSTTSTDGRIAKLSQGMSVVASVIERPAWWKTSYWFQRTTSDSMPIGQDEQAPFLLFQWASTYNSQVYPALLAKAADLEAKIPLLPKYQVPISEDKNIQGRVVRTYTVEDIYAQDIDGYYEDEFPDISWNEAQERLKQSIVELQVAESKYRNLLGSGNNDTRLAEIVDLLKKPLFFATADYKEQVNAAIADVRRAEADLEVAERDSLATEFEMFASQLIYEAASIEIDRQKTLQDIQSKNAAIIQLEGDISKIVEQQKQSGVSIEQRRAEIIALTAKQLDLRKEVARQASQQIKEEINILKKLLGDTSGSEAYKVIVTLPDQRTESANGQVAAIGLRVEYTIRTQLKTELDKAKAELKNAEDREREERKRQKRRRLISAICTFIGTAVGSYFGAPALGAQIGAALGELGNGILENKSAGEIFVGLIDNGLSISQAAGIDLEREFNALSTKGAAEVGSFFEKLDLNLKPLIETLPTVINEGLVREGFAALGLEAVPELIVTLGQSYDDLNRDIRKSPMLGTALKKAGIIGNDDKSPIQFSNADDLIQKLGDVGGSLFSRTKENASQIRALAQTIGARVDELKDNPEKLQDAGRKLGQLLIAQISRESGKYQRNAITNWITKNKELRSSWEQVKEEASALIDELFQDSSARENALANMRMAFLDPATLQAKVQVFLDPWQNRLNNKLEEVTRIAQGSSSQASAVDAARASVRAFEQSIQKFESDLVPWLKGDSPERGTLLNSLETKLNEDFAKVKELEELDIEQVKTRLQSATANDLIDIARTELESAKLKSKIVEIQATQASLQSRIAELTKVQSVKREEAEKNSYNAAVQRNAAAKAKVKAARYELESTAALLEAAKRRGAEASRIRGALYQPPFLSLVSTNTLIKPVREQYALSLDRAFEAYRQLMRYYRSADASQIPQIKIPDPARDSTWSDILRTWQDKDTRDILGSIDLDEKTPITWEFTPEQIAALFTPKGFSIVNGPNVSESPLLFRTSGASLLRQLNEETGKENSFLNLLFTTAITPSLEGGLNSGEISSEWLNILQEQGIPLSNADTIFISDSYNKEVWHLADKSTRRKRYTVIKNDKFTRVTADGNLAVYSRSLWFEEFERNGIDLSTEVVVRGGAPKWKIYDRRERNVSISKISDSGESDELWQIPTKSIEEFVAYLVTSSSDSDVLEVRRTQDPPEIKRSPFPNSYCNELTPDRAKTGRIIAVLLEAKIWDSSQQISENDYPIEVIHLGDRWLSSKYVEIHRSRPRKLSNSRVTFLEAGTSPSMYLANVKEDAKANGDPSPLIVPGTPLSGTTVIRLGTKQTSQPEFRRLKMTIYYNYFTPR